MLMRIRSMAVRSISALAAALAGPAQLANAAACPPDPDVTGTMLAPSALGSSECSSACCSSAESYGAAPAPAPGGAAAAASASWLRACKAGGLCMSARGDVERASRLAAQRLHARAQAGLQPRTSAPADPAACRRQPPGCRTPPLPRIAASRAPEEALALEYLIRRQRLLAGGKREAADPERLAGRARPHQVREVLLLELLRAAARRARV